MDSRSFTQSVDPDNPRPPLTDFLLILDKTSGDGKFQYLTVDDKARRGARLVPKVTTSPSYCRLQNIGEFRSVVLDNFLYVLGGRHRESGALLRYCHRYNPYSNRWDSVATMIRGKTRFAVVVMDSCIYICGGELGDGRITDTMECYDPLYDRWADRRPMPAPRADHAACLARGHLFVSGGAGDQCGPTNSFWQYEPISDFWSQASGKSALPGPRERHAMAEMGGSLYVLGGVTLIQDEGSVVCAEDHSVVSFDCAMGNIDTKITGFWDRSHPDMIHARVSAGVVTLGGHLYVIGGCSGLLGREETSVQYYNRRKKRWREALSLNGGKLTDVDVCLLSVPARNKDFRQTGPAMTNRWPLW